MSTLLKTDTIKPVHHSPTLKNADLHNQRIKHNGLHDAVKWSITNSYLVVSVSSTISCKAFEIVSQLLLDSCKTMFIVQSGYIDFKKKMLGTSKNMMLAHGIVGYWLKVPCFRNSRNSQNSIFYYRLELPVS